MNKLSFSRNIAASLAQGSRSRDFLQLTLQRRFPNALHKIVPAIASDLLSALPYRYAPTAKTIAMSLRSLDSFERAYAFCQKRNIWPDADLAPPLFSPIPAFGDLDLPRLTTLSDVADWLMLSQERLAYLADVHNRHEEHGETAINHYHYVLQKKKRGGLRLIEAPKQQLKFVQHKIKQDIVDRPSVHRDAFGFVEGRNCLQAAGRHVAEEVVICFDLKNFFPSIRAARVFGLFRCLGYPNNVARCLTGLCTNSTPSRILERMKFSERTDYRSPHLPQGSPVSPALANQLCFTLDRRLSGLARRLGAQYSRYADDLAFSGDREMTGVLLRAVPHIVHAEGLFINHAKTRIMSRTSRQVVTGVVVNAHLNIDRRSFDTLKATIHSCGKPGDMRLADPAFRASMLGQINWVETVNRNRGQKLRKLLEIAARSSSP